MQTIPNLLCMPDEQRQRYARQAGQALARGDERLATLLMVEAARQLSALLTHHGDQAVAFLREQETAASVDPSPPAGPPAAPTPHAAASRNLGRGPR